MKLQEFEREKLKKYLYDYINDICIERAKPGEKKLISIIKFNNKYYQMDMIFALNKELPWYLLYFGSNKDFSKKIRLYASKKGYKLNEYGLFNKITGKKINFTPLKEEDIFNFLKIKYIKPENRNKYFKL
jgi:DNA polymerase/3'-5' exonuclease PolX